MRIFFIVVMGALVANLLSSSLGHLGRIVNRDVEKDIGMTQDEYDAKWWKEHPKSWFPMMPLLYLLVVVIGFLWAVFWR